MSALNDLIESRELEVQCRHCGWAELRTLSWLGVRRDMNCPACSGVIILNTSERRLAITRLRRQVSALHEHLVEMIPAADYSVNGAQLQVRTAPLALRLELALASAYRETMHCGNDLHAARRVAADRAEAARARKSRPKNAAKCLSS